VVGYDDPFQADEVLLKLRKLQREYLLDLDKVLEELKGTGGRILKTSLSNEDEAKVQAALSAATS